MSPPLDLTDEEQHALVGLLTTEIEASRYPMSPRIVMLKRIRAKLRGEDLSVQPARPKLPRL